MKNIKHFYIAGCCILLTAVLLSSCWDLIPGPATNWRPGWIPFYLTDSNGVGIVNPQHPEVFDWRQIKVMELVDGELKERSRQDAIPDNGVSFDFDTTRSTNGEYFVKVYLSNWDNLSNRDREVTTVVQWNDTSSDTLFATFKSSNHSYIIESSSMTINGKPFRYQPSEMHCLTPATDTTPAKDCAVKRIIDL